MWSIKRILGVKMLTLNTFFKKSLGFDCRLILGRSRKLRGKFCGARTKNESFINSPRNRIGRKYKTVVFLTTKLSVGRRTATLCTDPTLYIFTMSLLPSSHRFIDLTPITSHPKYLLCGIPIAQAAREG